MCGRARGNVIARLRSGDNAPLTFQHLIRVANGHKTHAAARHLLSQRRQLIARQPYAKLNLRDNLLRQTLVFFHQILTDSVYQQEKKRRFS